MEFSSRTPSLYSYVYPSSHSYNNSSNSKKNDSSSLRKSNNQSSEEDYYNKKRPHNNNKVGSNNPNEIADALFEQLFGLSSPYAQQQQQQTLPTKPVVQQPKQQHNQDSAPTPIPTSSPTTFSPKVDILHGNDSYLIRVELAGVDKQDISIDIKKDQIMTISGEKKDPFKKQPQQSIKVNNSSIVEPLIQEASSSSSSSKIQPISQNNNNDYQYYSQESIFGKFSRDIQLPSDIDITQITASHENSILLITIPKQQDLTPQSFRINIQ